MKLYSIDMLIHATAYVRAETPKKAKLLAVQQLSYHEIELDDAMSGAQIVSGEPFDSEYLPDVSLSRAATIGATDSEPEEVQ